MRSVTAKSFKNWAYCADKADRADWADWADRACRADWDRDETFKKVLKSETFQQQTLKTGPNPRDVSVSKKKQIL